jgi:hypothetical protein
MADAERSSAWADRLAAARQQVQQRASVPSNEGRLQRQVDVACRALWALVEGAVAEANAALGGLGPDETLSLQRTENRGRISIGKGADARTLDLVVTPRVVAGAVSGGAVITTSQTRSAIPVALVQDTANDGLRWVMLTTLAPLTPQVIETIFLFAFGDDPRASMEVANYFGTA